MLVKGVGRVPSKSERPPNGSISKSAVIIWKRIGCSMLLAKQSLLRIRAKWGPCC